jgi:enoyl-CoA hydratase/carnithine racemase
MDITWQDGVGVITLDHGVNAFESTFVDELHGALDIVAASDSARTLVTVGTGKHYSDGFDIDFLSSLEGPALGAFMDSSVSLLGRLLTFPVPTVAALNGHAFGIGAMLALAHDRRVMRPDRGWFCLPEIDLGMQFSPFMLALVQHTLPARVAEEAVLTGRRWGGGDALAAGIAHATAPEESLVQAAIAEAAPMAGKDRAITVALKRALRAGVLEHLPTDREGAGG